MKDETPGVRDTQTHNNDAELNRALQETLQHPLMQELAVRLAIRPPVEAEVYAGSKRAAVAALLRIVDDDRPELLFIKRAILERDPWSGHVAFPGGRFDVSDQSLVDTAIRETREEVAIDITRHGHVLGRLDDLAPRSPALPPIIVRPFVAVVPSALPLTVSTGEVASAFWVPVAELRSADAQTHFPLMRDGVESRFPAYGVGGHVVWGLTERIVSQLLPLFDGLV